MKKTVVELFAGVGGFRVGLNNIKEFDKKTGRAIENGPRDFVWANQWEPATKEQHAFNCYKIRFQKNGNDTIHESELNNVDISKVNKANIPDHTLLTGGFPCQDYSVARSLNNEKGIEGKKGILWWQINDILKVKKPSFVLLENVDRLLKAPSKQRGQAFGIILRCFCDAGYGVQWRIINAADYGHPQRRRRIFIFAFHKSTNYYKKFNKSKNKFKTEDTIKSNMMFSSCFPCKTSKNEINVGTLNKNTFSTIADVSDRFAFKFENAGYCIDYNISTISVEPLYLGRTKTLGECLDCGNVPAYCYDANFEKFKYLKGSKRIERTSKDGHKYFYSEGSIAFPDYLDRPGRTMLTSEGTANRSSHFILDPKANKFRILTPIECERLDEFPDDWTNIGMSSKRRYFIAGNALVCGLITSMGEEISKIIDEED